MGKTGRVLLLVALLTASTLGFALMASHDGANRQDQVRAKGETVMPFDVDRTIHSFVSTASGGVQTVLVRSSTDNEQLRLVRFHLAEIATKFAQGDFSAPLTIHGSEMAGVEQLKQNLSNLTITYAEVTDGATLTYTSTDAETVAALHEWFAAQLHDHASDAVDMPAGEVTEELWLAHHPGEPVPDWVRKS